MPNWISHYVRQYWLTQVDPTYDEEGVEKGQMLLYARSGVHRWVAPTAELVHWSVAAHSSFQLDEQQWRYFLSIFSDYNGISHSFYLGWGPILKYKELSFSNLNTEGLSFKYLSDYYGAI